jgi:hypothetical protein
MKIEGSPGSQNKSTSKHLSLNGYPNRNGSRLEFAHLEKEIASNFAGNNLLCK